jgi:hypothetical protein
MTPCSPLSSNRRFGGTYPLHLQGRRIVQSSDGLHGVTSQKTILFITTAVKTSDPTLVCLFVFFFLSSLDFRVYKVLFRLYSVEWQDDSQKICWKEVVMAYFIDYPRICQERLRKNTIAVVPAKIRKEPVSNKCKIKLSL